MYAVKLTLDEVQPHLLRLRSSIFNRRVCKQITKPVSEYCAVLTRYKQEGTCESGVLAAGHQVLIRMVWSSQQHHPALRLATTNRAKIDKKGCI